MAGSAKAVVTQAFRPVLNFRRKNKTRAVARAEAAVLTLLLCFPAAAEPTISLDDAAARKPRDFTPLYEDRSVVVTGQVSKAAVRLSTFSHLAIQEGGHGLVLEGSGAIFEG